MTRADRRRHVDAWRASDLSREEYCSRNGIVRSTFVRWIRDYAHLVDPAPKLHATVSLLPVKVQPSDPVAPAPSSSSPSLELRSPPGFVWTFGSSMGPGWVAEMVRRIG